MTESISAGAPFHAGFGLGWDAANDFAETYDCAGAFFRGNPFGCEEQNVEIANHRQNERMMQANAVGQHSLQLQE